MERIHRSLVMRHEHLACALGEQMESGTTPSRAKAVRHHAPEACDGLEVGPTMGGEDMAAPRVMIVVEGRIEFVRPMDPAPLDHHDDLFPGVAAAGHPLGDRLAQLLRRKVRDHCREDFGGAVLDRAKPPEPHAARDTAPGVVAPPRLACAPLLACALAVAEGMWGQTCALGCAPPARPRPSTTPEARGICREQHARTAARLGLEGGKCTRAGSEISGGGGSAAGGAGAAPGVVFHTPRTLSRPSWTPVSRATTVASARPLHGEGRAPCSRGA
jgi:hypothetical protein